jgi:iron-sulfur cluster assembly protein
MRACGVGRKKRKIQGIAARTGVCSKTMSISLTESAANRVKTFLASRGRGIGLRLGVRKTGCSGFAYVINYADEAQPGDVLFEDRGVKVFVDPSSLSLLDGTTVDFVKQGLNEAFRFRNPNVKGECGCGESFSV